MVELWGDAYITFFATCTVISTNKTCSDTKVRMEKIGFVFVLTIIDAL
jgi:hypothetical protein